MVALLLLQTVSNNRPINVFEIENLNKQKENKNLGEMV